ncbi:MAG: hypothetical protein HC808_06990, partial [Candidatus Competibacteraceae bacterium]|nr:hypothetical protein [Candidatus Competibacteraceae bacterium]
GLGRLIGENAAVAPPRRHHRPSKREILFHADGNVDRETTWQEDGAIDRNKATRSRFYDPSAGRRQVIAVFGIGLIAWAAASFAHELLVFAWVDGDSVVVEGKFSNGRTPKQGTVSVYDGSDTLLLTLPIKDDGMARFPLEDYSSGLKVELDTGSGHTAYWILTPQDIADQRSKHPQTEARK